MATLRSAPLVVVVRDGWGENPNATHDSFNAVKLARTPVDDALRESWPTTLIHTSGLDVGVPPGHTGNSEVGHQNIGAGRVVDQEVVRISKACQTGAVRRIPAVTQALDNARAGASLHLMGIASDAGVHGLLEHLVALVEAAKAAGVPSERTFVHLFTDGRDTGPFTGKGFVEHVESELRRLGQGSIASVMGRYYAMDRDFRWERVERAWACLTGRGSPTPRQPTAAAALAAYYQNPSAPTLKGDEFVTPTAIAPSDAHAAASRVRPADSVIFYNYRGDRPREIAGAFVLPDDAWAKSKPSPDTGRAGFDRGPRLPLTFVAMTGYSEALAPHMLVAFPKPPKMPMVAGEHFAKLGLRQFRCAETEKFPHVTFFFNDYRDEPFPGETRENPQSPKVATYDLKPEMAAYEVRDAVLRRLAAPDCEDFILVNFANCDMVGHTGNLAAAIEAVQITDACVGAVVEATLARGGSLIVTADHGNAEQMFDPQTGSPHTAHTPYDVPLSVVGPAFKGRALRQGGRLADVVPTALAMLGLPQPKEMTGASLLI